MYTDLRDNIIRKQDLEKKEFKKDKALGKRESERDTKVEFKSKGLDKQHKARMKQKDKTKRVQMKDNKVHGEDQEVKRIITSMKNH